MKNITIIKSNGATKTYEINEDNPYIRDAKEIQFLCRQYGCDVAQAADRYNQIHELTGVGDAKSEFLHLVNDALMTGDTELMTLDKLVELL